MNDYPWTYPPAKDPAAVKILWDYMAQQVVDGGDVSCSLFDTFYVYSYVDGAPLSWGIERSPGDFMYLMEQQVPELVRIAVLVSS